LNRARSGIRICGEGRTVIRRQPPDIIEFVLDVQRYRLADHKIGRIYYIRRTANEGSVKHTGKVLGIPGPPVILGFKLTPYSRLDFQSIKVPWPVRSFDGSFNCEPADAGTLVVHRECFVLAPGVGRIIAPILSAWLSRDTPAEVLRMKRLLEAPSPNQ
jgi:hypothetical protein